MRRLIAVSVIGLLGVVMPAVSAQATPSTAVSIYSTVNLNTDPATGVWAATGAVTDSGTLIEPGLHFMGGQLQITRVVTGSHGTYTLRILSSFTGFLPDGGATFSGQWAIIAGTGQYATLHGVGERAAVVNVDTGFVTEALTGQAHFD
jgi:hypothetical protein